jgi:hypothetical protein
MLPLVLMTDALRPGAKSVPAAALSARELCIEVICDCIDTHAHTHSGWHASIAYMCQHVCVLAPEPAVYRKQAVQAVATLARHCPSVLQPVGAFLRTLSRNSKTTLRAVALDVCAALLGHADAFVRESAATHTEWQTTDACMDVLATLLSRTVDKVPLIRAKALTHISAAAAVDVVSRALVASAAHTGCECECEYGQAACECMDVDQTAPASAFSSLGGLSNTRSSFMRTPMPAHAQSNASSIDQSTLPAHTGMPSAHAVDLTLLLTAVRKRCADSKPLVRKAALQVMHTCVCVCGGLVFFFACGLILGNISLSPTSSTHRLWKPSPWSQQETLRRVKTRTSKCPPHC